MSTSPISDKAYVTTIDDCATKRSSSPDHSNERLAPIDEALNRNTLLRLDLVLVPLMAMFYFLAWLDRANIGNARVVCDDPGGIMDPEAHVNTRLGFKQISA
jgi:hypothetical protein